MTKNTSNQKAKHANRTGFGPNAPFVKLCLAPVNEEEFLFYSHLAMSAAQLQAPVTSPTEYGVNLLNEKTGDLSRIQFTDNPYSRMMVALRENLSEEEREEKMPALAIRIWALIHLLNDDKLKQWTIPNPQEPDSVLISEAVFRAAARATIDTDLEFIWEEFEENVEEILRLEAEQEQ